MREGFWLNYKTGKAVSIREHESDIRYPLIAHKLLGVPAKVFKQFPRFTTGTDRCKFLRWLLARVPLIRVRGHGVYVTFEFSAASSRKPYAAIVKFSKRLSPVMLLNIVNLRTGKAEQIIAVLFWDREKARHGRK